MWVGGCVPGWMDGWVEGWVCGWKGVCACVPGWVEGWVWVCKRSVYIFLIRGDFSAGKTKQSPDKVITLSISPLPFDDHLLIELYLPRAPPGFLCHCIVRLY